MKHHAETHEFALFYSLLSATIKETHAQHPFFVGDASFVNRIQHILRMRNGDSLIIFDRKKVVHAVFEGIEGKKGARFILQSIHENTPYKPAVTFYLPLLKKEALEDALYALVETGVTAIQLVVTAKTQKKWQENDEQRLERVMIAAAEQSKNFSIPDLYKPILFEKLIEHHDPTIFSLYADVEGQSLRTILSHIQTDRAIIGMVGPEGDLTHEEKELLRSKKFIFMRLTPTILRASQAAAVTAAFIRSIV